MKHRLACWLVVFCVLTARPGLGQEPSAATSGPILSQPPHQAAACDDARGRGGWQVGAELLLLAPRFESNPAYYFTARTVAGVGLPPTTTQIVEEFNYDLQPSPRLSLGYTLDSGVGARVRWFRFDHDAGNIDATNPAIPLGSPVVFRSLAATSPLMAIGPQTHLPAVNSIQTPSPMGIDERLQFTSDLFLDVWDFEAVYADLRTGAWNFEMFGGIRYIRVEQSYAAASIGYAPQFLKSDQTFDGVGPTFGLEGHRRLGATGLSFYGLGRVSLLFGEDTHVSQGLNIGLIPDFTYAFHDNRSSRERVLPMFEVEMGVEGTRELGAGEWVLRAGVVSQLLPSGSGANGNGNMGLIGLSLATGWRY